MAELKDVYSLEFNSSQFQSEIQSAIGRIEELNAAMEEGADVADQLAEAQGSLVDILGTEAKGIEQLNQKRNVLVSTSKQLNAESKTGVAVGKQLDATNKQIAVSTGNAVKAQKGFGASLLDGTRKIGQMRRVASQLSFAFKLVASAIPFGLILSFAGPVISFFSNLIKGTDETAENMEKLNDASLGYGERLRIIETELEKLNTIEGKRGKLTEEEKQRRAELTKAYQDSANEIIKIEEERYQRQQELEFSIAETRIKLLGDTSAAVIANAELERKKLTLESFKRFDEIQDANDKLNEALIEAQRKYNATSSYEDNQRVLRLEAAIRRTNEEFENLAIEQSLKEQAIEQEKNRRLADIAERARQEQLRKEKEFRDKLEKFGNANENAVEKGIKKVTNEALAALERRRKAEEEYQKMLDESIKKQRDSINELKSRLESESGILQDNRERELALQLLFLEQERNETLRAFTGNAEEQAKIDAAFSKRRTELETKANQDIIRLRIDLLKKLRNVARSQGDESALASIDKQIADLEVKFEELNKPLQETTEQTKKSLKELVDESAQVVQLASDTVFSVLNAQITGYIDNLDRAVDRSKTALDDIRQNSENFNARQLELEKERLERLEAERARAVEREKTLGQIQVAINAAIAISKAAAEGGGFASAFTIAATLASLIAGLAQARAAAGNAFFEGVEYLERGNNPRGRDTIPAMLNEGERVITTDTNNKYWDVLSAVHNNRIPAEVLNSFANAYQQGGLRAALGAFGDNISLAGELGQKSVFVNVAHNNSGLENRLERIEQVLTELPKYMPKTVVQANAKGIFRIVEQRQARKDFSRNWAK